LLGLIDELLDLSRIEADRVRLNVGCVDVCESISDAVKYLERDIAARGIQLKMDLQAIDARYAHADPVKLRQVLINLLSNAVKYNRDGGLVEIVGNCDDVDTLSIDVIDSGTGINPERLSLLFLPFERLGAEQTAVSGNGIGLSLSQKLMERMFGDIELITTSPAGTTFRLHIPLAVYDGRCRLQQPA
jgi:signal transduction histidine kinase